MQTLLALRQECDALKVITEKLRVKEMGPADHIRTKHEVKTFLESGDVKAAEALNKQAHESTAVHLAITNRMLPNRYQPYGLGCSIIGQEGKSFDRLEINLSTPGHRGLGLFGHVQN